MSSVLIDMDNPDGLAHLGNGSRGEWARLSRRNQGVSGTQTVRRCVLGGLAVGVHSAALLGFLLGAPTTNPKRPPSIVMITLADVQSAVPEKNALPMPRNLQPASIAVQMPEPIAIMTANEPIHSAAQIPSHPGPIATPFSEKADWASRVLQHLERLKRYPRDAVLQHAEGVVMLHFTIDRSGQVLRAWIDKSSGYDALDDEALALIRRAAPLPKPPESVPSEVFDLAVPVTFSLKI